MRAIIHGDISTSHNDTTWFSGTVAGLNDQIGLRDEASGEILRINLTRKQAEGLMRGMIEAMPSIAEQVVKGLYAEVS